jgi:SAM-dependent methyltransferase
LTEESTIRDATTQLLADQPNGDQVLRELYDTRLDAWRAFVIDILDGRCLDLYAGYGRRSLGLGEIVDSVYAVDPDLSKLRVLNQRDDFESADRIVPIHGDGKDLPFGEGTFDTVVADYTGRSAQLIASQIEFLDSIVRERGTMIFLVDGPTRKAGLTGWMGLDDSSLSLSTDSVRSTVIRCERVLGDLNYGSVRVFALWPISERLSWVYELGDRRREYRFVKKVLDSSSRDPIHALILKATSKGGVLQHLFPNFLVVGSKEGHSINDRIPQSILKTGRSRSILFEYGDELLSVKKIPNRVRHSKYNEREHELVQEFRIREPHIREYLPEGALVDSPFGSIRKEKAVDGKPLSETLGESATEVEQALTMGLDWLVDFQRPSERDRVEFSVEEYITNSGIDTDDFGHLQVSDTVELFTTPVHGDLTPKNVYVENGEISTVIDWEYSHLSGNPIVDAGFYVAYVLAYDRKSAPEAMVELCRGESQNAQLGREAAERYCEKINIDMQTFLHHLPIVYIHQVGIDYGIDATGTYTKNTSERLNAAIKVWGDTCDT